MKKILGVLAVCLLLVGFVSCGEDEDTNSYITFTFGNGDVADWNYGVESFNNNVAFAAIISSGNTWELRMIASGYGGEDVDSIKLSVTSSAEFVVNQSYTNVTGTVYRDSTPYTISSGFSVTLKKIGDIGGIISGTFTGTIAGLGGALSNGKINLQRVLSSGVPGI